MTWKVEKRSYSSNPWRLIDENGSEVYNDVTFDHPDLGKCKIDMPVCGPTKQSVVDQVLGGFAAMKQVLRQRTVALKVIHTWAACDQLIKEHVLRACNDALSKPPQKESDK